ncbi:MAG TPA: TonB-dependent receptor, partial [Desulfobacteraceae bacterium]|nr:TonB-dependent receptor [Desulfobacteraceae bacterium]
KGNLGINIFPIKGLRIKTQYSFVGKRYFGNDYGNTQKEMESYDTVDIYLSYKLNNIEFFINGKNIFNEKYSDYGFYSSWVNSFNYYPMPEATFLGGINMVF